MANVDRPNGFVPVRHLTGAPYNGMSRKYISPTDNLFLGDLVEADGTGSAAGYPSCARAEASDVIQGVVVGWEVDPSAPDRLYHAASATLAVYIADSPDLVLQAQADDGTLTTASVGLNVNFVVAAGSTSTGVSNMEVDGSTGSTVATLPLKLLGFVDKPDNEIGSANHKVEVSINSHVFKGGTGTAGI